MSVASLAGNVKVPINRLTGGRGMRKVTMVIIGLFLIASFAASAQEESIFHVKGDQGETVHVLPGPASARNPHFPQPSDHQPSGFATKFTFTPTYHAPLTWHGSSVISGVGVKNIFWNSSAANAAGTLGYSTMQSQMSAFLDQVSGSPDYTIIGANGNYSLSANTISTTIRNLATLVDTKATQSSITDSSIQSYIAGLLTAGRLGTADSNAIYAVYFPSGMSVRLGSSRSCSSFCGYHSSFSYNGQTIKYAAYPWSCSHGCSISGKGSADMWTIVTSHEIREAVTDPANGGGDGTSGYEAGDKC